MADQREYVPVLNARDVLEAEFYKTLLEANDIPAIVQDENSEAMGMPMSIMSQGVPVLVPREFKEQAGQLIIDQKQTPVDEAELEREAEAAPSEDDAEQVDDDEDATSA